MKRAWTLMVVLLALGGCASIGVGDRRSDILPEIVRTSPDRLIVVTVANEPSALANRAGSTPRAYGGLQKYSASGAARDMVDSIARDYQLSEVAAWPIPVLRVHCVVFEIPAASSRDSVLERLAHEPRVKVAQALGTFQTMTQTYNDPYVGLQHGFEQIDVADAHRWSRGDGVRVAIIDTGMDVAHPELKNKIVASRNFVDADSAQFRHDRHGTAVAGVIAAIANNKLGIVGVAPGVKLIALKACWQVDDGTAPAHCNSFTLARALVAAMDEGAQVVNLSLAGPADPLLSALVERGMQRGIAFVGSVSPSPSPTLSGFPAGTRGVLAVGASEAQAAEDGALLAPGNEILTLTPEGHYDFATGSSLATAHVTGTVALLLARNPQLRPEDLYTVLRSTSIRSTVQNRPTESINACAAVAPIAERQAGCTSPAVVADQSFKSPESSMRRAGARRSNRAGAAGDR
jgi:hypothetical protein